MSRRIVALAAIVVLSGCTVAGGGAGEHTPAAPAPEPDEELRGGSAALEEAGLSEAVPGGAPAVDSSADRGAGAAEGAVESDAALGEALAEVRPGAFLYPAGGELPEAVQRQVEEFVEALTVGRASERFRRWLEREEEWGDWIRGELRAAGLPEELVYLAMIESGFHPTIVSHAGATGMWQFMPATARRSGLRVDSWVDERRDPEAATRAAIRHLIELHEATGDWALSAAAYNAGLGRVSRARARQPAAERDYFSLSMARRLPRETRNYVPIMLAAAWVDAHRDDYDLPSRRPRARSAIDTLTVDGRLRLSVLAEALAVPHDTLEALNAHLVRGAVPPEGGTVLVPAATDTAGLAAHLAAVPRDRRLLPDWHITRYRVRSGDSWWRIARQHDTTVDRLRRLNPRQGDVIHPGDRLVVRRVASYDMPGRVAVSDAGEASAPSVRRPTPPTAELPRVVEPTPGDRVTEYVVRAGDTMSEIAERLGVTLDELARWNGMAEPRPVRIGEVLRVAPPVIRYTVLPGDTMTGIARRYDVGLDQLAEWNGMEKPRPLRTGETLLVRLP